MDINSTILTSTASLLIFAEIGFIILLAVPAFKGEIKERFDKQTSQQGRISTIDFIIQSFLMDFSRPLLIYSIMYLLGSLLILLAPIQDIQSLFRNVITSEAIWNTGYFIIVATTLMVFVSAIRAAYDNITKALRISQITLPRKDGNSTWVPNCPTAT
jgi:hypothetical protein